MLQETKYKIEKAKRIISETLEKCKNPYLSISFGKDSVVMYWIVKQVKPDIQCVWFDGGKFDEYPDTYEFKDKLVNKWDMSLDIIYPKENLIEQWRKYGIPERRFDKAEQAYNRNFTNAFIEYAQKNNCDCAMIGMRASESKYRRFVVAKMGYLYYTKYDSLFHSLPVYHFQTQNIWDVIDGEKLPYHPIYDQTRFQRREDIRLGVLSETAYANRGTMTYMKYYYPALYNDLIRTIKEVKYYAAI